MKNNRLMVIILVVSVALNLLLVGMMLGRMVGPHPGRHRVDPAMGIRWLIGELPPERAAALAPLYREFFSTMRLRFGDIRRAQRDLRAAMLTEPLDETALRHALQSVQQQLTASQGATQEALIALASELTSAERRQLVENMERRPEGWRPGRPRPDHPDSRARPD